MDMLYHCLCILYGYRSNNTTVPELRIYKLWETPIGPHPVAMFEVNLFTPAQFGAFIPWLVINRGPLSVLIHPNTVDPVTGEGTEEERNHTQRATWMGERLPLDTSLFKQLAKRKKERKAGVQTE
jgi:aromatic ring-cleaving dioxygenase